MLRHLMLDQGGLLDGSVGAIRAVELSPVSLMNLPVAGKVGLRGKDLVADVACASFDILLCRDLMLQLLMSLHRANGFVSPATLSTLVHKCFLFLGNNIVIHAYCQSENGTKVLK